jgi:hypothetical protein
MHASSDGVSERDTPPLDEAFLSGCRVRPRMGASAHRRIRIGRSAEGTPARRPMPRSARAASIDE